MMSLARVLTVRPVSVLFLSSLIAAVYSYSARAEIRLDGQLWNITTEGEGSVGINGIPGTPLDLENDLGYTDEEVVFGATVLWGDRHQVGGSYLRIDVSGATEFDQEVKFSNLLFPPGFPVESSLEATVLRGFYRYRVGSDSFRFGPIAGFQYLDFNSRAAASGIGSARADITTPMPIVGAFLEATPTEWLRLQLSGVGIRWDFDDVSASFWDVEGVVMVGWNSFFLAGGYRQVVIDGEHDRKPTDADITFKGPMGVFGVRW